MSSRPPALTLLVAACAAPAAALDTAYTRVCWSTSSSPPLRPLCRFAPANVTALYQSRGPGDTEAGRVNIASRLGRLSTSHGRGLRDASSGGWEDQLFRVGSRPVMKNISPPTSERRGSGAHAAMGTATDPIPLHRCERAAHSLVRSKITAYADSANNRTCSADAAVSRGHDYPVGRVFMKSSRLRS